MQSERFPIVPLCPATASGHKTDCMFRRYAIVNEEQKREALAKTQEPVVRPAESPKVVRTGKKQ